MSTHTQILLTDLRDVAIHASSLWDGFVSRRDSDDLFHIWGMGGIELHTQMAELAMLDAQLCNALYAMTESGFPSVYTYEVTEELGNAVALHLISTGNFPTDPEWQHTLGELAYDFFAQGAVEDLPAVSAVLHQSLPGWRMEVEPVIPSFTLDRPPNPPPSPTAQPQPFRPTA